MKVFTKSVARAKEVARAAAIATILIGAALLFSPYPARADDPPPPPATGDHPTGETAPPRQPNPLWGEWNSEGAHSVKPLASYQRVDGARLGVRYTYHADPPVPLFSAETGYAFARRRWLYDLRAGHALFDNRVVVQGGIHRLTRSFEFDDEIVGAMENTIASLLLRDDYREYFEGEGGHASATLNATDKYAFTTVYTAEEQRPLSTGADWSLFDRDSFRPNPAIRPGTLRSLTTTLSHDSRPRDRDAGTPFLGEMRRANRDWVRLTYETAGRGLGGDFDYGFARLDARGYWKLSPQQFFSARLLAGKETEGHLPVQKEFYAGGISTLRAHAYKEFRGDRQFLLNAEYAIDLVRAAQGLVFADIGRAWFAAEHPNGPRLPIDVGFGVQTRDERLRMMFARDTRDPGAPLFVTIRTQASF